MYTTVFWGGTFRTLRESSSLLQKQLSDVLCITRQEYSHIEIGRCRPKVEYVAILSYIYENNLFDAFYKTLSEDQLSKMDQLRSLQRQNTAGKMKGRDIVLQLESQEDMVADPGYTYGKKHAPQPRKDGEDPPQSRRDGTDSPQSRKNGTGAAQPRRDGADIPQSRKDETDPPQSRDDEADTP